MEKQGFKPNNGRLETAMRGSGTKEKKKKARACPLAIFKAVQLSVGDWVEEKRTSVKREKNRTWKNISGESAEKSLTDARLCF